MSDQPIHEDEPLPGHYRTRVVRNGPWVPALIWTEPGEMSPETGELMSDDTLRCIINGHEVDPYEKWVWLAKQPISMDEYWQLVAAATAPNAPPPGQAVDPLNDPVVF